MHKLWDVSWTSGLGGQGELGQVQMVAVFDIVVFKAEYAKTDAFLHWASSEALAFSYDPYTFHNIMFLYGRTFSI